MKRIPDEEIKAKEPQRDGYTYYQSFGAEIAQAQLDLNKKDMRELFEALDKYHTITPFYAFTVYMTEVEYQALKEKYL